MSQITLLGSNMFLDNNLSSLGDFLESFHPQKIIWGKNGGWDVFTLQLGPTSLIGFTIGKRKSSQIPKENCTWDHVSLWGAWLHFPNENIHPYTTLSHFLMKLLRDEKWVEPKWGIGAVLSLKKVATLPKEQYPTKFNVLELLWMNVSFHLNFSSLIPTFYSLYNFLIQNFMHWVLLILD
jgi:hypothetical protein